MALGRDEKVETSKLNAVQYLIAAIFLLLGFGLWRLQISGSDRYEVLAERNRIRTVPILAPRGKILDREGRLIVDNYPSFSALLLREQAQNLEADIPLIAKGLNIPEQELRDRVKQFIHAPRYQPIVIKDDITPDELAFISANRNEIPELETVTVQRRLYPKDGFLAHLIGYTGEVSESDLKTPEFELHEQGDIVGKSGVEEYYNELLTGKDGERRSVVDNRGREVDRLSKTPAEPGQPLKLTIDLDLQIAAEQAMGDRNGALVAMDPRTGEVLAMVSRPAFDPNQFAVRISQQNWSALINDPAKPLMNKAIQAQLAPGSVFKIIMSVAGLQEGIAQTMHVNCPGGGTFYGRYFRCWVSFEHRTHGEVDITKAIYQSCDTFFYTLGERLGIGKIAQYAQAFGLGQRTGIDLPQEVSGVMPSEEWKLRNFRQKWFAGETISVAIGQGAIAVTPMQLARAISAISMGGRLVRPHVVFADELPENFAKARNISYTPTTVGIDPKNWELVTDAMTRVVNPEGTAPSAHLPDVDFAGKTGSAQVISIALREKLKNKGPEFNQNSWFVGFEPRRDPDVIVAVLFEGGEHGKLSARIAAQVIQAYVNKKRRPAVKTARGEKPKAYDVGALWTGSDLPSESGHADALAAGHFTVTAGQKARKLKVNDLFPKVPALAAVAAGGAR
jgi:penicillin-binding protein 2